MSDVAARLTVKIDSLNDDQLMSVRRWIAEIEAEDVRDGGLESIIDLLLDDTYVPIMQRTSLQLAAYFLDYAECHVECDEAAPDPEVLFNFAIETIHEVISE